MKEFNQFLEQQQQQERHKFQSNIPGSFLGLELFRLMEQPHVKVL
jgi:hypothetical protein